MILAVSVVNNDIDPADAAARLVGAARTPMAAAVAAFDWASTPLGPIASWPQGLRAAVGICLNSRFPMFVWWGPQLINIYNDGYVPMLGKRHPAALGRPARETWNDIWNDVGPQADAVMRRGEATWNDRRPLRMERNGYVEDTWFTWSYSPIPNADGSVGGLFCAVTEETQRVRAEAERDRLVAQLESERAKLADLFERSPSFIALLRGPEHVFEMANELYYQLVGRRDLIGKSVREALPEIEGQGYFEILDRVYRTGEPFIGDEMHAMIRRDPRQPAREAILELVYLPVREPGGAVTGIFAHGVDVTQHKLAEASLRQSEERFRAAFDQAAVGIVLTDLRGIVTRANEAFCQLVGRTADELVGRDSRTYTHPDDLGLTGQIIGGFREGSVRGGAYEKRYVRKDGAAVWAQLSLSATRDATGEPEGIVAIIEDVTHRKVAEAALARDAMLLANVRDAVIVTDLRGIVTFWNEGATRLFGFAADEMLGRPLSRRLPESARAEVDAWIGRIATGDAEFAGEWLDWRKDGSRVWIEVRTRRISDADGKPVGVMGVSHEITERKRAEQERDELLERETAARSEAERASRMKDEFLATLSHELRTPLNAILGWSQILSGGNLEADDLAEGLRTIERNARAQTQIIEDLLDMSRIISGKVRLNVQRVELAALVRASMDTVKPAADVKGIRLEAKIDADAGDTMVLGDASRLQQVFWNLLNNAIKFTPKQGRVEVRLEREDASLAVSVADSGEGIAAEFLPHVFDRFRQADASTTRRHGGLGLGLAIVKQLVELHGGSVGVTSEGRGRGATFTLALPIAAAADAEPQAEPGQRRPLPGAARLRAELYARVAGVKVLVVDDEPDARALIERLLEGCDAVVISAGSAAEAMERFRAERPDVVISDVGMPGEDGHSLVRRIRALPAAEGGRTPAVALTAYARAEDRAKAVAAGFQIHVTKPVEPAELLMIVATLAGRGRGG
jgi:PAS domain S-box-containing protein